MGNQSGMIAMNTVRKANHIAAYTEFNFGHAELSSCEVRDIELSRCRDARVNLSLHRCVWRYWFWLG